MLLERFLPAYFGEFGMPELPNIAMSRSHAPDPDEPAGIHRQRLESLDAFRGFTIFRSMGGALSTRMHCPTVTKCSIR